ncbi:serine/arginine repetitive matrix protein 1 [Drosophila teissieri]|uniref:serine/arginine repetitive matrix protein 1 n=1 Tax=Drosophila teissieri TaxID=7243 RepID=UPI001CBA3B28|nr:serine/arginine repetitive matrix protein 1 [Drosophila teissieri]
MDIFDMVKAAPPPQTINTVNTKISTPSPIPPDSPIDTTDLLESGNQSSEDDLHKKTAIQDDQITGGKSDDICEVTDPEMRLNMPRKSKKIEQTEDCSTDLLDSEKSDEDLDKSPTKKRRKNVSTSKPNKTKKATVTDKASNSSASTPRKKRPTESWEDDEASEDDQQLMLVSPTKTKAQQKMFSDQQSPNFNKKLRVLMRRLRQPEIDSAVESLANSSFVNVIELPNQGGIRGRRRPNKRNSSPQKQKSSPTQTNFHIKVPLQNGAKKRALNHASRIHTPPPSLAKRARNAQSSQKPSPKPKLKSKRGSSRGRNTDLALVERYGARFFGCVVKVRRTRLPTKWPDCSPRPIGGLRKGHPKKAVSFSEAVEILGSPEGPSRRATFGSISSKGTPKPTRLQRVDATGNVLEDIALTSTPLFSPSAGTSTSGGSRERGRRRSCNGSPVGERLKRSNQRLQLSRMARLSIDDSSKSGGDDEDEEYIVPNDVPGAQRSATPPPKKKKISFTTTISDDEDEKPAPKKQKDAQKRQPKPHKESTNKKTDKTLKEKETTDITHTENEKKPENSNEIVKEKVPLPAMEIESDDEEEIKPPAEEIQSKVEEGEGDAHEAEANEVERDREDKLLDATEKNPDEASQQQAEEQVEDQPELKQADNSETQTEDAQEEVLQDEDAETVEENAAETTESLDESPEKPTTEDSVEKVEEAVEQTDEFSDMPTPPQLPSTTDETPDDVLEIQTSLDDVRQLHTPPSRLSTPKPRVRLDSGDSDCSFKSASDHGKQLAGQAIEETQREETKPAEDEDPQPAATIIDEPIESAELPAELMTPPMAATTVNGEPTSGSSATAPYYSPMETMATLDDEVLGQLVEPDFQLNSSRHAISRGTLDEIMTALES